MVEGPQDEQGRVPKTAGIFSDQAAITGMNQAESKYMYAEQYEESRANVTGEHYGELHLSPRMRVRFPPRCLVFEVLKNWWIFGRGPMKAVTEGKARGAMDDHEATSWQLS